jgi:hypothetical protein
VRQAQPGRPGKQKGLNRSQLSDGADGRGCCCRPTGTVPATSGGTGAELAWRIKKAQVFVPLRRLSNGSFPSVLDTPRENVRYGQARAAGQPLPGPPARHPRVG